MNILKATELYTLKGEFYIICKLYLKPVKKKDIVKEMILGNELDLKNEVLTACVNRFFKEQNK